jgi:hypothetical protein
MPKPISNLKANPTLSCEPSEQLSRRIKKVCHRSGLKPPDVLLRCIKGHLPVMESTLS